MTVTTLSPIQDTFGGLDSYMTTSQFVDLVHKHAYQPNIRFHVSRWGQHNGAPAETCTMSIGNTNDGNLYNIPMPTIPARTQIDSKTEKIVHRGWRALLVWMLGQRICRPNKEFELYLGTKAYQEVIEQMWREERSNRKVGAKPRWN